MAGMERRKHRKHTHNVYVDLHNNEDRIIGDRTIALVFASGFLALVWASRSEIDWEGQISVALLGLFVTLLMWRTNIRGAQAVQDWRYLANEEEKRLYGCHPDHDDLSNGPYGLRQARDRDRNQSSCWERFIRSVIIVISLGHRDLGHSNLVNSWLVPFVLALWWVFAIVSPLVLDWPNDKIDASDPTNHETSETLLIDADPHEFLEPAAISTHPVPGALPRIDAVAFAA